MKRIILFFTLLFSYSSTVLAFTLSNFETPESMIVDPKDGSYFVSNINGEPLAKDGNGYISKINANGNIVIQKFIGSKEPLLNAPKGMVIVGENLFVTDIDVVRGFQKETGKAVALIDLSTWSAKFLNDIALDDRGFLYVSDTMMNRIFKIDPKNSYAVSIFKEGHELGSPNGLLFNPKTKDLMMVTFETGRILEIDHAGKVHVLKRGLKSLDGIDVDGQGNLYVSSFENGEIYKIAYFGRGALSTVLSGLTTPADISYDRKKDELLIPSFKGNTVSTIHKK